LLSPPDKSSQNPFDAHDEPKQPANGPFECPNKKSPSHPPQAYEQPNDQPAGHAFPQDAGFVLPSQQRSRRSGRKPNINADDAPSLPEIAPSDRSSEPGPTDGGGSGGGVRFEELQNAVAHEEHHLLLRRLHHHNFKKSASARNLMGTDGMLGLGSPSSSGREGGNGGSGAIAAAAAAASAAPVSITASVEVFAGGRLGVLSSPAVSADDATGTVSLGTLPALGSPQRAVGGGSGCRDSGNCPLKVGAGGDLPRTRPAEEAVAAAPGTPAEGGCGSVTAAARVDALEGASVRDPEYVGHGGASAGGATDLSRTAAAVDWYRHSKLRAA